MKTTLISPWIWLILAVLSEVAGTFFLKLSDGFSKPMYIAFTFLFYGVSFTFLAFALKKIELGMTYAIWAGVGTGLVALIGIFVFNEPANSFKLFSIALIIAGVIGLNLAGAH